MKRFWKKSMSGDERVDIPCNYCTSGTISVPKGAVTQLGMTWGVCAKCRDAIKNSQICEVCHHKLFQDCDWKVGSSGHGPCEHKAGVERLNHIEWGVHVCNEHHKKYTMTIEAMYSEDEEE